MIVKRKDGYYVISHTTGRNLGGPYNSEEKAKKRLAQVRAFKYMKKKAGFMSFIKKHPVKSTIGVLSVAAIGAGIANREELGENYRALKYLGKHKYYVYKGGRELDLSRWQLIKHDYTKLRPSSLVPYTNWFQSSKGLYGSKDPETYKKFREAARQHYASEMHHAHKIGKNKPMKYWMESIADSYSVNKNLSKDKNFPSIKVWFKNLPAYKWKPEVREEALKRLNK